MLLYPWKMIGRYIDDAEIIVNGYDETDCMERLIDLQNRHGKLTWYSGYSNENYVNGEYIGRENFLN